MVTVAATQFACSWNLDENLATAESLVRSAAAQGANIILLQELFAAPYFCKDQDPKHFDLATPFINNNLLSHFSALAKELSVVLPISYFEKDNQCYFNSLAVIDADGVVLDNYRKVHIPDGPGYQEKFYFSPGDTPFKVWSTKFGRIGVAICWDQWFPEAARAMVLHGAEILFYPTAIGSEPQDHSIDSKDHWQRAMQGHSASNMVPVVASNRIGVEQGESCSITFYGSSFISDNTGAILQEASRDQQEIILSTLDLNAFAQQRRAWGLFRDRRPELYGPLTQLTPH